MHIFKLMVCTNIYSLKISPGDVQVWLATDFPIDMEQFIPARALEFANCRISLLIKSEIVVSSLT